MRKAKLAILLVGLTTLSANVLAKSEMDKKTLKQAISLFKCVKKEARRSEGLNENLQKLVASTLDQEGDGLLEGGLGIGAGVFQSKVYEVGVRLPNLPTRWKAFVEGL